MNYKIYRKDNYIFVEDERGILWEEHYSLVKISKKTFSDTTYTIEFLRPEPTREAFLFINFLDILTETGVNYPSVAAWETWVVQNTGPVFNSTSGLATEATLQNVDSNVADILANTDAALRTPNMFRTTTYGNLSSVATKIYSVSVANVGTADGIILGSTLKPGEILNFDASSLNHYFNSFAYDATNTEFILIYIS